MCAVALSSERYVLAFGKVKDPLSLEIALQYLEAQFDLLSEFFEADILHQYQG